jgi:hypothetical protein
MRLRLRNMRDIKKIILHCSDSSWGDASIIDSWHKEKGWDGIGYNFVLLNGFRAPGRYNKEDDGLIEVGRPIGTIGAHCKGQNHDSIGVCLIGKQLFSANQLYVAIPTIMKMVNPDGKLDLLGHYEFNSGKRCPNIDMNTLKSFLENRRVK